MIDRLPLPIDLPYDALADYCRRWKITKLEVFGSVLGDDFGPESDVDFLVTFAPDLRLTLFDLVDAEDELAAIVGRPVDIVEREPIEQSRNWMRRKMILGSARTIYVG
ncbi:MAG: nucleotidyltransferase domain-containing protein [Planctomycetota bacterium]|jgi:predicted nucleotidyltransferase